MTKISPRIELFTSVSDDVSFVSEHFPKYKLGRNNQILEEPAYESKGPSVKDAIAQEIEELADQHKRLSVRDIASKFDKNLFSTVRMAEEANLCKPTSLEGHVILKKLRDVLETIRCRMVGQKKEHLEDAISMVEALAVKLTQKEVKFIQEKFEVKKFIDFLKQATDDAKRLVNKEKIFSCAEIQRAKALVQQLEDMLIEEERTTQKATNFKFVDDLNEEVQESRRIKLMHCPNKVTDMEHELCALRQQIREKSILSVELQKEVTMRKRVEENKSSLFILSGSEILGSSLIIKPRSVIAPPISKCSFSWYHLSFDGTHRKLISGANHQMYTLEPFDVGLILQVDIFSDGQSVTVTASGPIAPAPGLKSYLKTLQKKTSSEFKVVILQMNEQNYQSSSLHVLNVGKVRIKISRGWITKAREVYSPTMKICGVRAWKSTTTTTTIAAPSKAMIWQPREGQSFVLAFQSELERNAAIVLTRNYALDCNVVLGVQD